MTHTPNTGMPEQAAVVGTGYVGLTLLCALGRAGLRGIGYDINAEKVAIVNAGRVPFEGAEPEMADALADLVGQGRLAATGDPAAIGEADAVFVAVETPVDDEHQPRYTALRGALAAIGPHLKRGALVCIESTIAPGTMHGLVLPALSEATGGVVGRDFHLVHCPERVMPGRLWRNITSYDRVVGGVTPICTERAMAIYRRVTTGTLHPTCARTAEVVKTAENAYRDVQIAFANEVALMCEELGVDVHEVRELVNSSPFRQMHLPGAGVGGHCIPKDPWLLCAGVHAYQPRLLPAARAVNDGMPEHMVQLLLRALAEAARPVQGAVIGILGAAYLEESDDLRNTPALPLARQLRAMGAQVRVVDPHVDGMEEFAVTGDISALDGCDAVALVTAHAAFTAIDLPALAGRMRTPILVDGRNAFSPAAARAAGLRYLGIGKGKDITAIDEEIARAA